MTSLRHILLVKSYLHRLSDNAPKIPERVTGRDWSLPSILHERSELLFLCLVISVSYSKSHPTEPISSESSEMTSANTASPALRCFRRRKHFSLHWRENFHLLQQLRYLCTQRFQLATGHRASLRFVCSNFVCTKIWRQPVDSYNEINEGFTRKHQLA